MKLVFATSNRHKVEEAKYVLSSYGITIEARPIKGIEIQSEDVGEIAKFAVTSIADHTLPVFVEDTGLYVDALCGFPGAFSAYVFKTIGNRGLLRLLDNGRSAYFESAVALRLDNEVKVFKGRVYGSISYEARGENGFGFDPVFIPEGSGKTFGEIELKEKCRISHRAAALRSMAEWLKENSYI